MKMMDDSIPNGQATPRTTTTATICAAAGTTARSSTEDGHPVVWVGAGSHASYFQQGEYQAKVALPVPSWISGLRRLWNKFWTGTLGQPPRQPVPHPVRGLRPRRRARASGPGQEQRVGRSGVS